MREEQRANAALEHENTDYYKVLGIKRSATLKQIERAYRYKSLESHPRMTVSETRDDYHLDFKRIAEAWDVLKSVSTRKIYD